MKLCNFCGSELREVDNDGYIYCDECEDEMSYFDPEELGVNSYDVLRYTDKVHGRVSEMKLIQAILLTDDSEKNKLDCIYRVAFEVKNEYLDELLDKKLYDIKY